MIKKLIILLLSISILSSKSLSDIKLQKDFGILTLMYHRFNEQKYPSTNIKLDIFKKQVEEITKNGLKIINFHEFKNIMDQKSFAEKSILLTIDDGFLSFYENAWPIFKENKIPFILFVNTKNVGSHGYMDWEQLKEISKFEFVKIGNHSHSHEYLLNMKKNEIIDDIKISVNILKKNLNIEPDIFSYPFGEYDVELIKIVEDFGFKYAFGQHSGIINFSSKNYELPRFPINEKYGDINRFRSVINFLPFPYEKIVPENKYLTTNQNPPDVKIIFFKNLINIKNINCYSNEEDKWEKSNINFINENEINIKLRGKFTTERGRINCSLLEKNGKWRWLGIQYVLE
jgi:peptidoglycan/xylan/chitin deacetylase (PgdA/CDA1 family)